MSSITMLNFGLDMTKQIDEGPMQGNEPCAIKIHDTEYFPVVACKDCKYWEQHEKLKSKGTCKCPRYDYVIETDDPYDGAWLETKHNFWCGYGERKEQEHGICNME